MHCSFRSQFYNISRATSTKHGRCIHKLGSSIRTIFFYSHTTKFSSFHNCYYHTVVVLDSQTLALPITEFLIYYNMDILYHII